MACNSLSPTFKGSFAFRMVGLHLSRNITPVLRNIVVPNGDEESSDDAYVDLHYLYSAPSVVRAMKCDSLMTD